MQASTSPPRRVVTPSKQRSLKSVLVASRIIIDRVGFCARIIYAFCAPSSARRRLLQHANTRTTATANAIHPTAIYSGLESEKNFGGDSDETFEHLGGLPAELSFRRGKQRVHTG